PAPAARLRDALPPVPERRHHAAAPAPRPAALGLARRRLGGRGRLRERVPLRGPSAGGTAVPRPRGLRHLPRVFLEDRVPGAALGLSGAAAPPRARLPGREVGGR